MNITEKILALLKNEQLTTSEIASKLGLDKDLAHKTIVEMRRANLIEFLGRYTGWSLKS